MKPATTETADIVPHLRQQLILAQVRIMELEDTRDELTSRLARIDRTLTEMQSIVQDRIAECDVLARQRMDLETQLGVARQQLGDSAASLLQSRARESDLQKTLAQIEQVSAGHQGRVGELEVLLRTLKNSRSWRWTAPLRSLERLFRRAPRE
jgi:chromosome segregation ATPase